MNSFSLHMIVPGLQEVDALEVGGGNRCFLRRLQPLQMVDKVWQDWTAALSRWPLLLRFRESRILPKARDGRKWIKWPGSLFYVLQIRFVWDFFPMKQTCHYTVSWDLKVHIISTYKQTLVWLFPEAHERASAHCWAGTKKLTEVRIPTVKQWVD